MKKSLFFICIGSLMASFSCKEKKTEKQQVENNINFDTIYVADKYYFNNDSTLASCDIKISFVYPTSYTNDSVLKKVQQDIVATYFSDDKLMTLSPKEVVPTYVEYRKRDFDEQVKSFKEHLDEFDASDSFFFESEEFQGNILFNKSDILSFQVKRFNSQMDNVVHTQLKNCVIDLQTGNPIYEEDIFVPEYEPELHKLFVNYLLKTNNAKSLEELDNDGVGYTNLDGIMPNRNFFVDNEGVTYVFNSGEYSSPLMDAIIIKLPYKDIKHLIKPESPIAKLI